MLISLQLGLGPSVVLLLISCFHLQNRGRRMVEGAHINRSLLALGNCINALVSGNKNHYINYRDSKLTRLLKVWYISNYYITLYASFTGGTRRKLSDCNDSTRQSC